MTVTSRLALAASLLFSVASANPQTESPPAPCSADAYHQFDFWLGEWQSFSANGEKQGDNRLHRVMGTCAIQENWTSANRQYRGTSFNFYDAATGTWHQTWIDNRGGHLFLSGGLQNGSMQLTGPGRNAKGEEITHRITWTPLDDGRVRQHWQTSADGEQWNDAFDGYYQRKTPAQDSP